jgi:hypothetical protein
MGRTSVQCSLGIETIKFSTYQLIMSSALSLSFRLQFQVWGDDCWSQISSHGWSKRFLGFEDIRSFYCISTNEVSWRLIPRCFSSLTPLSVRIRWHEHEGRRLYRDKLCLGMKVGKDQGCYIDIDPKSDGISL